MQDQSESTQTQSQDGSRHGCQIMPAKRADRSFQRCTKDSTPVTATLTSTTKRPRQRRGCHLKKQRFDPIASVPHEMRTTTSLSIAFICLHHGREQRLYHPHTNASSPAGGPARATAAIPAEASVHCMERRAAWKNLRSLSAPSRLRSQRKHSSPYMSRRPSMKRRECR